MDFLAATRRSYDALAPVYPPPPAPLPFDRALWEAFAEMVPGGLVLDAGCGNGWVTDALHRLGLSVVGIDVSPGMVAVARQSYPSVPFLAGSMLSLPVASGSLGGLLASYSIIHVPWDLRPALFCEFQRVHRVGGVLMLAFQVGDEHIHRSSGWGVDVDLNWYRQQPSEVASLLRDAGFAVVCTFVRRAQSAEKSPHAVMLAVHSGS